MSAASDAHVLAFAGFFLDARQRLLVAPDGRPVTISSRAFETLLYLAEHPDELIEKQRLLKAVWPNSVVEENNLNQHISMLRRILGEAPGEHRFIVTVPGRGFRFVARVERLSQIPAPQREAETAPASPEPRGESPEPPAAAAAPSPGRRLPRITGIAVAIATAAVAAVVVATVALWPREPSAPARAQAIPSIAVLPFADLSPNRDQAYFADGLSEEVLNTLGRLRGLRVIGRTSSFSFKGKDEDVRRIGQTLGVQHVLEGSVRREGERLRITAQLVDATTGSQRWAETYDRKLGDVFAVQTEIANAVATALKLALDPQGAATAPGGTRNVEAYESYLSARAIINDVSMFNAKEAVEHLERAVQLDPDFALAWAALAEAYTSAADFPSSVALPLTPVELQQRSASAALRAFELAPNASQTLRAAGAVSIQNRDWGEAERRLLKAVELAGPFDSDANLAYGRFLVTVGRIEESIVYLERAVRAEPLLIRPVALLATAQGMRREFAKAAAQLQAAASLPGDQTLVKQALTTIYMATRDYKGIRRLWPAGTSDEPGTFPSLGDPEASLAAVRREFAEELAAPNSRSLFGIVLQAAFWGDPELSLQAMQAMGTSVNILVIWQPGLEQVRELPGFRELVRELGLVDYWRSSGKWGEFCQSAGNEDFTCR